MPRPLKIGAVASGFCAVIFAVLAFGLNHQRQEPRRTFDEYIKDREAWEAQEKALADQGDAVAQFNLGTRIDNNGTPQNYAEAAKWFRKAAEQGLASAQFNLGLAYSEGQGVPQDYTEAAKWFHDAAEQGEAVAQTNLGALYGEGHGVPQDYTEAAKWYRKAADQGESHAQYNLGRLYAAGHGVTLDYEEAYFWLILGSTSGDGQSTALRSLPESHLTPQQIVAIQKRAREWKPTKG